MMTPMTNIWSKVVPIPSHNPPLCKIDPTYFFGTGVMDIHSWQQNGSEPNKAPHKSFIIMVIPKSPNFDPTEHFIHQFCLNYHYLCYTIMVLETQW